MTYPTCCGYKTAHPTKRMNANKQGTFTRGSSFLFCLVEGESDQQSEAPWFLIRLNTQLEFQNICKVLPEETD